MVVNKKITITMILALLQISIAQAGEFALHRAAQEGQVATVAALLAQASTDVNRANDYGLTPLHEAVKRGHANIVRLLLNAGADIEKADNKSKTPLHWAANNGNANIIRLLLNAGADLNKEDQSGDVPLHIAVSNGHAKIARLLIEAGADVNKENDYGSTPLHYAAMNGCAESVKLLINAGADIDKENDDGETPLHRAIDESLRLLIKAGANVNGANDYGTTALLRLIDAAGLDEDTIVENTLELVACGAELPDNIETSAFFRERIPSTFACCKLLYESRLHHINQFLDKAITQFNLEADHCNSVIDHSLLPFMLTEKQLHRLREIRRRSLRINTNRSTLSGRPTKRQKRSNQ